MTQADVYIVFTTEPKEEQIEKLKETCERLGLTLEIGAPIPPKK
jgi:hypothetical protein